MVYFQQDQDRLKKLKTEHEFQRRVREIAEKGDYDYEDDDEMAERIYVSLITLLGYTFKKIELKIYFF